MSDNPGLRFEVQARKFGCEWETAYETRVREHADAVARSAGNLGWYEDVRVIDHEEVSR